MKIVAGTKAHDDGIFLVNAYLDGELDAAAIPAFEKRLRDEPRLKEEYDRLLALRSVIAAKVPKDTASDSLRAKIAGIADNVAKPQHAPAPGLYNWQQMAASILFAMILASGATMTALRYQPVNDATALITGHQRALLASSSVEVVSEDRHTVKPWFDSHLALSPRVADLASSGFTLLGGRADQVAGKSVPVIVYRIREHVISVVATPKSGSIDDGRAVTRASRDGYSVLTWPGQDFVYSAISDVADADLSNFVTLWRDGVKGN